MNRNGLLQFMIPYMWIMVQKMALQQMWSSFHAARSDTVGQPEKNIPLPLFHEKAATPEMIRHGMGLVKRTTEHLNPYQVPVFVVTNCLYTEPHYRGMLIRIAFIRQMHQWTHRGRDSGWKKGISWGYGLSGCSDSRHIMWEARDEGAGVAVAGIGNRAASNYRAVTNHHRRSDSTRLLQEGGGLSMEGKNVILTLTSVGAHKYHNPLCPSEPNVLYLTVGVSRWAAWDPASVIKVNILHELEPSTPRQHRPPLRNK